MIIKAILASIVHVARVTLYVVVVILRFIIKLRYPYDISTSKVDNCILKPSLNAVMYF